LATAFYFISAPNFEVKHHIIARGKMAKASRNFISKGKIKTMEAKDIGLTECTLSSLFESSWQSLGMHLDSALSNHPCQLEPNIRLCSIAA
jgi:hypothetical protein